jgi:hypothetical protein
MTIVLETAADGDRPPLRVRRWLAADMQDLLAAMTVEYPARGLWSQDRKSTRLNSSHEQ